MGATAFVVIGQDGAGAREGGRMGQASGAQDVVAFQRDGERNAAAGAAGAVEKTRAFQQSGAKVRLTATCARQAMQRHWKHVRNWWHARKTSNYNN